MVSPGFDSRGRILKHDEHKARREFDMWEARAEYEDGTSVERYFDYRTDMSDGDQQYELECWLIERHPGCTWYSVNFVA